ncbi:MAG: gliding motility lipoprotein GldD [Luteibaculaceae bacterium]
MSRKINLRAFHLALLFIMPALLGCSDNPVPKPKGYFRLDFPEKNLQEFNFNNLPVSFSAPDYIKIEPVLGSAKNEFWFNIVYKPLDAKLYLSYAKLDNNVISHIEANHKLTYEHQVKATAINTKKIIDSDRNVFGLQYELKGNVATPLQFYLTDSTQHFIRGSLYFNFKPNYDSIAPALQYIKRDVELFINSAQWNPDFVIE